MNTETPLEVPGLEYALNLFYDESLVSKPRDGYKVGDNPYSKYKKEDFVPPDESGFLEVQENFRETDIYEGSWIRACSRSGSQYDIHVMGLEDEMVVVAGQAIIAKDSFYFVGTMKRPSLDEPLHFSDFARFRDFEELRNVRYIDPEELRGRIAGNLREQLSKNPHATLLVRKNPADTELQPFETTGVVSFSVAAF